jgi:hypothetical protein
MRIRREYTNFLFRDPFVVSYQIRNFVDPSSLDCEQEGVKNRRAGLHPPA